MLKHNEAGNGILKVSLKLVGLRSQSKFELPSAASL